MVIRNLIEGMSFTVIARRVFREYIIEYAALRRQCIFLLLPRIFNCISIPHNKSFPFESIVYLPGVTSRHLSFPAVLNLPSLTESREDYLGRRWSPRFSTYPFLFIGKKTARQLKLPTVSYFIRSNIFRQIAMFSWGRECKPYRSTWYKNKSIMITYSHCNN